MKSKKVTVISILAVILALAIIYLIFFSTLGLHIYNGKDGIISAAQSFSRTAIVTKSGDVYINGSLDDAAGGSLGIAKPKRYRNLYNSGRELKFVSLYSGHNAASVWLSRDGGAVITNGKEAYVFHQSQRAIAHPQNSRTTFSVRDRPASAYIFSQPTADSDFLRLTIPPLSPS